MESDKIVWTANAGGINWTTSPNDFWWQSTTRMEIM